MRAGLPPQGYAGEKADRPSIAQEDEETRASASRVKRGFTADAFTSIGTVVLAIIALSDLFPTVLGAVACIVAGAALVLKSSAVAARFMPLTRETGDTLGTELELGGGMSTEMVAGIAGVVLGILAVIGIFPTVLTAIAVIAFGTALFMGGGETYRVSQLWGFRPQQDRAVHGVQLAAESAAGVESLAGIGAIVLGIIALCMTLHAEVLVLVGLLVVGSAELVAGGAVSGYLRMLMSRQHSVR